MRGDLGCSEPPWIFLNFIEFEFCPNLKFSLFYWQLFFFRRFNFFSVVIFTKQNIKGKKNSGEFLWRTFFFSFSSHCCIFVVVIVRHSVACLAWRRFFFSDQPHRILTYKLFLNLFHKDDQLWGTLRTVAHRTHMCKETRVQFAYWDILTQIVLILERAL